MNRHDRRKAKVMQSAIARANRKAVGTVCIEEIIRDPNTCVAGSRGETCANRFSRRASPRECTVAVAADWRDW